MASLAIFWRAWLEAPPPDCSKPLKFMRGQRLDRGARRFSLNSTISGKSAARAA